MLTDDPQRGTRWPRFVLGVALLVAATWTLFALRPDTQGLREAVDATGAAGPLVFVVLYAVLTVLLVPGSIGSIAAGALFGPVLGTALTLIAATVGATASFFIGRVLGRDAVERWGGARVERLDAWIDRRGFLALFYVRLVPLFPFNLINYAAGLTSITAREYVVATALGIVPGTVAYVALGSSISAPGSPRFIAALLLVIALALAGPLLARFSGPGGRAPTV